MLAKDYWQLKTFCWVFHTHICRAHQASRAVPWLYCAHSSQSWPALAHLMYKILLPVPNPVFQQRIYQYCICISLPVNHEGYTRTSVMTENRTQHFFTRGAAAILCLLLCLSISTPYSYLVLLCCSDYTKNWQHFTVNKTVVFSFSMPVIHRNSFLSTYMSDATATVFIVRDSTLFFRTQVFPQY